jgi:hypothetical protein
MTHRAADPKQIVTSDNMWRPRQSSHIHGIRVIAQMNNIDSSGGAPQLTPEEKKFICVAQPLE